MEQYSLKRRETDEECQLRRTAILLELNSWGYLRRVITSLGHFSREWASARVPGMSRTVISTGTCGVEDDSDMLESS